MEKAAVLAIALLLAASLDARATESVTCDKTSLAKLETDVNAMSGKDQKKAMKRLTKAKKAFEDGNTKKCERMLKKLVENSAADAEDEED